MQLQSTVDRWNSVLATSSWLWRKNANLQIQSSTLVTTDTCGLSTGLDHVFVFTFYRCGLYSSVLHSVENTEVWLDISHLIYVQKSWEKYNLSLLLTIEKNGHSFNVVFFLSLFTTLLFADVGRIVDAVCDHPQWDPAESHTGSAQHCLSPVVSPLLKHPQIDKLNFFDLAHPPSGR